jgi:hypothetical protein
VLYVSNVHSSHINHKMMLISVSVFTTDGRSCCFVSVISKSLFCEHVFIALLNCETADCMEQCVCVRIKFCVKL